MFISNDFYVLSIGTSTAQAGAKCRPCPLGSAISIQIIARNFRSDMSIRISTAPARTTCRSRSQDPSGQGIFPINFRDRFYGKMVRVTWPHALGPQISVAGILLSQMDAVLALDKMDSALLRFASATCLSASTVWRHRVIIPPILRLYSFHSLLYPLRSKFHSQHIQQTVPIWILSPQCLGPLAGYSYRLLYNFVQRLCEFHLQFLEEFI